MSTDTAAWFVDGSYLYKVWRDLPINRTTPPPRLDYTKLRKHLESKYHVNIAEAYYFNADADPPTAAANAFHTALQYPPPNGPGLRVKLYWLQRRQLKWPQKLGGMPVVHPDTGEEYEYTHQKGVDVGLSFHLMRSHRRQQWRTLFLGAGDGDFHEVVQHLVEDQNVKVVLIGTLGAISSKLLPYAQDPEDMNSIAGNITRPEVHPRT